MQSLEQIASNVFCALLIQDLMIFLHYVFAIQALPKKDKTVS